MSADRNLAAAPWRVSLHGGHSGEFCDHAEGSLRDILVAAASFRYHTFGVSEHAPRGAERFLYPEEVRRGWDVARTEIDFARYAEAIQPLVCEFAENLTVLRGFEAEVVPSADYAARMRAFRSWRRPDGLPAFDYMVGSVHYVEEVQIDGSPEDLVKAADSCGGPEALVVRYYESLATMVETLAPDVVGHLDLIKRNFSAAGFSDPALLTSVRARAAANNALESVRAAGAILDLNTAGWRKGLGEPYPAPWLVRRAGEMGVSFCFGDDSHRVADVGAGVDRAREYLLGLGVATVTVLTRESEAPTSAIVRRVVPL